MWARILELQELMLNSRAALDDADDGKKMGQEEPGPCGLQECRKRRCGSIVEWRSSGQFVPPPAEQSFALPVKVPLSE